MICNFKADRVSSSKIRVSVQPNPTRSHSKRSFESRRPFRLGNQGFQSGVNSFVTDPTDPFPLDDASMINDVIGGCGRLVPLPINRSIVVKRRPGNFVLDHSLLELAGFVRPGVDSDQREGFVF